MQVVLQTEIPHSSQANVFVAVESKSLFIPFLFECAEGCDQCLNDKDFCVSCLSSHNLDQERHICTLVCPMSHVLNGNQCQSCKTENCMVCDLYKCLRCMDGYVLEEGSLNCILQTALTHSQQLGVSE